MEIKEHKCIFVDFNDNRFGYSVLVFKNGKHIYYANDYELHHGYTVKEQGKEGLRNYYIKEMSNRLYTDTELTENITSYDEYKKKDYFLRNYWIMRYSYLSVWMIGKEAEREFDSKKPDFPFYSPVSFCYLADAKIVETQKKYFRHLEMAYKLLKKNDDVFREMISYELANHEACVTCDCTDALEALGYKWDDLTEQQQVITKQELEKQISKYC